MMSHSVHSDPALKQCTLLSLINVPGKGRSWVLFIIYVHRYVINITLPSKILKTNVMNVHCILIEIFNGKQAR